MRTLRALLPVPLLLTCLTLPLPAVTPQPGEFLARQSWVDQAFSTNNSTLSAGFLKVVYEDTSDAVTRGRSWRGTPYQLGEKTYRHGIAFNSTKHILVHLGRPARRFTAEVGLENNDDTRRGETMGQGSVTFEVRVGGRSLYTSPVRRRADGPLPLDLNLDGAQEFEIRVGDGGDGRGWDQALWAEAIAWTEDGSPVRLQDLPWAQSEATNPFTFAFRQDGKASASLLPNWQITREPIGGAGADNAVPGRKLTYRDPAGGLEISVETSEFKDFPAVEWLVRFTNTGTTDTPILEDIQAVQAVLPTPTAGDAVLHWAKGGVASFDDFAPQETILKSGTRLRLHPGGGRSSNEVLPFFNLEGADAGVIAAVGWTGEWAAEFACDSRNQISLKAGLDHTHLLLHPGETIRTPRMLLLFYEGESVRGQNLLRQFLLAHHRPQRSGKPLESPITCGNWGGTAAAIHLDNIRRIQQHRLPIDYYWIDAEWYGQGGWPVNVGNWEVKHDLYPAGFRPLSDALRHDGHELMLWFEPERVYRGTAWHKAHPEWLLPAGGDNFLLNLGIPAARQFLADFIDAKVKEFGLGCYRQDFNIDPLASWRAADAPDRQGMTEIRYIEGLYAFWDELRERNPGLILDNCASGGRRIDLETVGRATPFWRTDGPRDAIAHQCHTYGLLSWVPLSATSQDRARDDYEFRSSMCSSLCLNWWVSGDAPAERIPDNFPFEWAKATLDQHLRLRPFYYGDYQPLTGYSQARDVWMAYELDRPDLGQGLVVALRRPESPYESGRFPLKGIDPAGDYRVTVLGETAQHTVTGRELVGTGLEIRLSERPGSALVLYERISTNSTR